MASDAFQQALLESSGVAKGAQGGDDTVDREQLARRMDDVGKNASRMYQFAGGMTLVVFIVLIGAILIFRDNWTAVTALSGVMGLTVAAAIDRMAKLAKDVANTGMVVQLSSQLSGEEMAKVVQALIAKA
jgi:hypothetical protein